MTCGEVSAAHESSNYCNENQFLERSRLRSEYVDFFVIKN